MTEEWKSHRERAREERRGEKRMLGRASWFIVLSHGHLIAGAAIFSYYGRSVLTSPSELPPTYDVM